LLDARSLTTIRAGAGALSYAYEWQRCNAEGAGCAPIEGASEPSYTLTNEDRGKALRVKVTVTVPLGSQSAVSAPTAPTPGGEASVTQAEETAQQTDPSLLAPSATASLEEQSVSPALSDGEEGLSSQQALTSSSVSKDTAGEFAVNTPAGELSLIPVESSQGATENPTIVNGAAALFANTWPATDTIVRSEPLGATAILQLRSSEAPKSFSWEVRLGADQQLRQLSDGSVAVINAPEAAEEPLSANEPVGASDAGEGQPESEEEQREAAAEETEADEVEAKGESEDEVPLEPLPAAPLSSTPQAEPIPGQPQPQDTQADYSTAQTAMSSSEAQTAGQTLMVIQPPAVTDANANPVPASLSVAGDTVTLTIKPTAGTTYPMLGDMTIAAPSDKVSAERDPVHYGLADQNPANFEHDGLHDNQPFDPNLKSGPLKIAKARLRIPYDVLFSQVRRHREPLEYSRLTAWLAAVRARRLEPYITLGPDEHCGKEKGCAVPSPKRYRAAFTALLNYGYRRGVKVWGAWNEPDLQKDPLYKHNARAAQYWQVAQYVAAHHCACKVVAGEFAFENGYGAARRYVTMYRKRLVEHARYPPCRRCARGTPPIWGFHDYHDVTHPSYEVLSKFTSLTGGRAGKGRLWISEAGVELQDVQRKDLATGSAEEQEKKQRQAASRFRGLEKRHDSSARLDRIYYYSYRAPTEKEQEGGEVGEALPFDSGLFETKQEPETEKEQRGEAPKRIRKSLEEARPAYCVLAFASGKCPAVGAQTDPETIDEGTCGNSPSIVLDGAVTPNGLPASYYFEYGSTTAYGSRTAREPTEGDTSLIVVKAAVAVAANRSGETHFRLVAHNAGGTTKGLDNVVHWGCGSG
jgi:hypothetical protein